MTDLLITLLNIVQMLLSVFWWIIVVQAILSWLIAFNVINTYNDFVRSVWNALRVLTEPIYRPIRRILPDFGGLDLSPMVVLLGLIIVQNYLIPLVQRQIALAGMGI